MPDLSRRSALAALAASGVAPMVAQAASGGSDAFIRRDGPRFLRHGRAWRHVGANAWYCAWLAADPGAGLARLRRELDRLAALGVSNVRLLAGAEDGPLKASIHPGFVDRSGKLNEPLLVGLDRTLAELDQRGMTGVLTLTNYWEWSGGMMTWLWYETGTIFENGDPGHPWPAFPDAASAFYAHAGARVRFAAYVTALLKRTNSVTGRAYADDPTIMSWQLANEPRPGVSPGVMARILPAYYHWIDETAALIRRLAPRHMVSLGLEGTIATGNDPAILLRAHRAMDYHTAHVWPLNWGWVSDRDLPGTWARGMTRVRTYLSTQIALARRVGKPLVIEEFGFPRDTGGYDPALPTTFRERYYRLIYAAAETSLASGGPIQGTNFWGWNGEGRAQHADHRFAGGDTQLLGDPPHEPQGWYGNFDSDRAIGDIVKAHAQRFATLPG